MKRALALALLVVTLIAVAVGGQRQNKPIPEPKYLPHRGETVLQLSIESRGDIYINLETKAAPKATDQIIKLTREGFYDGQRFFKVIQSPRPYLIQTGDPQSKTETSNYDSLGSGGSGVKVPYEDTHLGFTTGAVVLATVDNNRDSGDSQFYILLGDYNRILQGTATVFGKVVSGMEVANQVQLGDRISTAIILNG